MGYYSNWGLEIEGETYSFDPVLGDVRNSIELGSGYLGWSNGGLSEAKFYNVETVLTKSSTAFPKAKVSLYRQGEDGEKSVYYAYGGNIEVYDAIVICPRPTWKDF